jgi:hypothetical protein
MLADLYSPSHFNLFGSLSCAGGIGIRSRTAYSGLNSPTPALFSESRTSAC